MELVLGLAAAFFFGWIISSMGAESLDRLVGALAQFMGGWRPDTWPRGVQEEDRDRPWGRPAHRSLRHGLPTPELKPNLHRVRGTVGHR